MFAESQPVGTLAEEVNETCFIQHCRGLRGISDAPECNRSQEGTILPNFS
jgi:hypothetical protein